MREWQGDIAAKPRFKKIDRARFAIKRGDVDLAIRLLGEEVLSLGVDHPWKPILDRAFQNLCRGRQPEAYVELHRILGRPDGTARVKPKTKEEAT